MEGQRNVVLFAREEVRLTENGDAYVFTGTLSEISQIKKKPGRYKKGVYFRPDMKSDEVRSELEKNFPCLQNRRFSCAARATQNSARFEFRGERRVWDGKTISKLKGESVLYLVMEDELPVTREAFCGTESTSSMQGHSCYSSDNSVNNQQMSQLLPQSATVTFSDGANCNTKANIEDESNLHAESSLSPLLPGSFDYEELMDGDFPQLSPDFIQGYFADLPEETDSTPWNGQSRIPQGDLFVPSVDLGNCRSDLGLTDQTGRSMTLPAFNNTWNGTVGAMPPTARVLAQSQPYQNQVSEFRATYTDTGGQSESSFLSEGNSSKDQALDMPPEAVVEINPAKDLPEVFEASSTYTSDTGGRRESGFSSEGSSSMDQALDQPHSIPPEASAEIKPTQSPLEGGGVFQLKFDQSLPDGVTSAWATFGNKRVEVRKTYECSFILHGESIPAGEVPGTVTVTITTKNGDHLGKTLFTYVNQDEEILMQIIKSRKLQGKLFTMLGKQCENDESEENNAQTFGLPSDVRQRQAMDILRCLVYTAAGIGAEEFIRMIFSTSAGRIVFEAYKKESPLPEDMADANGHEETATFLRAITKRFSEEETTSQVRSECIYWHELASAVEKSEEQSVSWLSEKDVKQRKEDDLSEREYFGDAETSSTDSEKERCDYEDQFEARFIKDHDPIQMGLDPSHQMTERDMHDYKLPEKIGRNWRDLARALDYNQANINRIQKDQGGSAKECCIKVLVCWMSREGRNATVEKLAEALVKAELKNVADELMCIDTTQLSEALRRRKELHWLDIATLKREETKRMTICRDTELSKALGIRKEPLHWLDIATLKREETKRMLSEALRRRKESIHWAPIARQKREETKGMLSEALGIRKEPINWLDIKTLEHEETKRMLSEALGIRKEPINWLDIKTLEREETKRMGIKMRRKIKELEDELSIQIKKLEESKRMLSEAPRRRKELHLLDIATLKREETKRTLSEVFCITEEPIARQRGQEIIRMALSRNRTDPGTRQKQTKPREEAASPGTPPASDEEKSEVCFTKGLGNSVDAATGLEDVSGATRNDIDTDQKNRELRITIQLKNLDEKLKKELTSLLQVPVVNKDKLKTAVKLDLLTKLSESLQNMYSKIQAMVAETCKCNEDLKREFYDFAYNGLKAEHIALVLRVKDLESSQAEMSDKEKQEFERLQQYQNNRQRQIDRLENFWRGLFSSPESLPETSSSYPTGGNNNSKKALSRNRTDPGARQKQTKPREEAASPGTPPASDEEKSEVCLTTIQKGF